MSLVLANGAMTVTVASPTISQPVARCITVVLAAFPKMQMPIETMQVWQMLLGDIDAEILSAATIVYLRRSPFEAKPGDIGNTADMMTRYINGATPHLTRQRKQAHADIAEMLNTLPENIRQWLERRREAAQSQRDAAATKALRAEIQGRRAARDAVKQEVIA